VTKILVLRFSSLGDIVMTTAMLRSLRKHFPDARIDMIVRADFLDLVCHNPHLSSASGLSRSSGWRGLWELRKKVNAVDYDIIYDAHRSLRTLVLMPFLKARRKFYYRKHYLRRSLALLFKLPLLRHSPRFLEKFVEPLIPLGVRYDGGGPEMIVEPAAEKSAIKKLTLPPESVPLLGVVPSAQWPGKRWPPESFRKVVASLVAHTDFAVVVFGGPGDGFCADICRDFSADRVINSQGLLTLAESAAIVRRCQLVIANDTGLMHVADALGIPSVLIFGPTSGELGCLPFHPLSQIVEHQLWCRPCSKNGEAPCIRGRRVCLERTTPAMVVEATLRLWRSLSPRSPA
jgi:heptosyltransferase-2